MNLSLTLLISLKNSNTDEIPFQIYLYIFSIELHSCQLKFSKYPYTSFLHMYFIDSNVRI